MKRTMLILVLVPSIAFAIRYKNEGNIDPAFSDTATVIIPTPGAFKRNCLDDLILTSTSSNTGITTFRILDNQTTTYMVVVSTSNPPFADEFIKPWCSAVNSSTTIKSDGRAYQINYQGHIENMKERE